MATQQRSVIVTAIVLAIILGGALVWLLNRTPATQLATQAPGNEEQAQPTSQPLIAQAQQPTSTPAPISPTESNGSVQGVTATAPTGPADMAWLLVTIALGSGGLLVLTLTRFQSLRR